MSAVSISFASPPHRTPEVSWLGATRTARELPLGHVAPPWYSSSPASAPWAWIASAVRPSARASRSSQTSADIAGRSSASGEIEAYSTHTPPQPPSAFTARNAACALGLAEPNPDACGTW